MNNICNRVNVTQRIIESCNSLKGMERASFASVKGLIPDLEKTFSDYFWDYHDISRLWISLKIIKDNFDNTKKSFPEIDPQIVKDELYLELLMKFCKLAEDLGALLLSRDKDMFKFAQKYNKYTSYQVTSFYEDISLTEKELSKLYFYPLLKDQNTEKAKYVLTLSYDNLKTHLEVIRDTYLKYRDVYNSYKHGHRLRFNGEIIQFEGKKIPQRVIMYYNSKKMKNNPFQVDMIRYNDFSDSLFEFLYDECIAIINLNKIFLHNFKESLTKKKKFDIHLFFDPIYEKKQIEFLSKDVRFKC